MKTKVLSKQTLVSDQSLYNANKLVAERPIEVIKDHGLSIGFPFKSLVDNYRQSSDQEGNDISKHGPSTNTDLLLLAVTEPLA